MSILIVMEQLWNKAILLEYDTTASISNMKASCLVSL